MSCLAITPAIRELASRFGAETLSSVKNAVALWQEREMAKEGSTVTIESVPDVDTLHDLYEELRSAYTVETKVSKDDWDYLLDEKEFPEALLNLADRLGVSIKKNLRTRTLEVSSNGGTSEDVRLFRALAIDVIYQDDSAERAFEMTPHERLAAIIDWEVSHRRDRSEQANSLRNYEIQLAKRSLYDDYGISTDGELEAMRKQAAEQMTSTERMARINEIVYWFDKILTERHEGKLKELADRKEALEKAKASKDKSLYQGFESIDEATEHTRRLLNTDLSDLGLSVRAAKRLSDAKLKTVADIVQYHRAAFQRKANLDSKSLSEIVKLVDSLGFSFGMDVDSVVGSKSSAIWEDVEAAYDRELSEIQSKLGSYSRLDALKEYDPNRILDEIKRKYSDLLQAESDDDFVERVRETFRLSPKHVKANIKSYRAQAKAFVDNFMVLASEAASELEATELVKMNLKFNEVVDASEDMPHEQESREGEEEGDVEGVENQYKENWMFEYDTVSNWSKTPAKVRQLFSHCQVGKRVTKFGAPLRFPVMQVMNTLIKEMIGVQNSEDMDLLFESLVQDYPWIQHIREEIAKDSQLKTQVFITVTRYAQVLGILERNAAKGKSKDMTKSTLKIINSANTVDSIYVAFQYQIQSGIPVNRDMSIYDGEQIDKRGIEKVNELIDEYTEEEWDEIAKATPDMVASIRQSYPELVSDIRKMLTALGFVVSDNDIRVISARDVRDKSAPYKNNLAGLVNNTINLLKQLDKNGYETVKDLLDEPRDVKNRSVLQYYKEIAKILTLTDSAAVEPSVREKGKVRYSLVQRSNLDDLITGLQGKVFSRIGPTMEGRVGRINMTPREYAIKMFGDDPRFATKITDADGNVTYHFRNFILDAIVNDTSNSTPAYFTLLNADTFALDKQEQKNLTQNDRLNIMWSLYHMMPGENANEKYENTYGRWYPIPLPSDSGRMAYISFPVPVEREEQDRIIREAIIKELDRMLDPSYTEYDAAREGDHPIKSHVPLNLRKNKRKFCTFTYLNDPEISGYTVKDILDAYGSAVGTDQMLTRFEPIMKDLVGVVRKAIVEKFVEENRDYYAIREKTEGAGDVEIILVCESLFQMAMNELINGDPAYYSGYDDIQKRGKHGIVPKSRIDVFNPDFLKSYKEYHGIDPDAELDEEDITEHCLYINDPQIPSPSYDDIVALYDRALRDGLILPETHKAMVDAAKKIKHTDGQALRAFESMRMLKYAMGEMKKGDALDQAFGRIARGEQQEGDAHIVQVALKPLYSGLVPFQEPDGSIRLVPVQQKVSEQLLTAALIQAYGTKVGASPALRALARLMNEEHVDVAIFSSGVKSGDNGAIDFGDVNPETATEEEILEKMRSEIREHRAKTGMSLIHEVPYSYYGFVAQNSDTGMDESTVPIGVQLQKLISADLPDRIKVKTEDGFVYEEAKYPVEGIGELTKHEIISWYNKLMTQKILREYQEVTGIFADKKKLSEKLMKACRNSSRNSAYLERAFSLDEHGNFVIPLCDLATINMSSEFLNSIVKNAVSRVTSPGKQLVSMSAFGFANELKLEFERDEDGVPIRYSAIDCLLPAWSKHIVAKCVDERGVLDFEKIAKESPQLLRAIGVRIPTQFKNFILPLRCVGFLPSILGDTIVTAIDSVVLQDADFDNDKVPTLFPSFTADYMIDDWEDKAFEDYKKYSDQFYDWARMRKDFDGFRDDGIILRTVDGKALTFKEWYRQGLSDEEFEAKYRRKDAPEGKPMTFAEFKKVHKEEYLRPDGPKLEYVAFDPNKPLEDQSEEAINNGIINVMYGMLTGRAVSTMSLASGSTEKLKTLKKKIEGMLPKGKYAGYNGPADISTRIGQETRNNDGKVMIAVFANAEAMQAILQHTLVALRTGVGVTINGRTLESLHEINIEGTLESISRYIGTALGGAADNAKDPILSVLNINLRTAPVVSLMLQLGYTMGEVAMFLNIPSIRHYTDTGSYGDFRAPDMNDLPQVLPDGLERMEEAIRIGYKYNAMDQEMRDYCQTALGVFTYLESLGERMRSLSSLVRGDSGGTAPHGPIENNLVRFLNYELFQEAEAEDPVFENWRDIVDYDYFGEISPEHVDSAVDPIAQAYITYGVVGAFKFLARYYPGIDDPGYRGQIKNIIKKYYGGRATATNVKNVMHALNNYIESSFDCMCKEGMTFRQSRNYYMNIFPEEAARIISEHPELGSSLLFRRLRLFSTDENSDPFITLLYDGTMLKETRDEFTATWQQMFYAKKDDGSADNEVRRLALDLFKYCYFRNGMNFGPGSYAHLAPNEARTFFPGYNQMLDSMQSGFGPELYKGFEHQFVRNNLYDYKFCMTVPREQIKPDYLDKDGVAMDRITIKHWTKMGEERGGEAKQSAMKWFFLEGQETPRTAFVITEAKQGGGVQYLYYMKVSDNMEKGESVYALTTPLGWAGMAVEYSATEPGLTMPSVYDQEEVAEAVKPKRKRRRKSGSSTSSPARNVTTGDDSNSSEAPNEDNDDGGDFWGRRTKKSGRTKTKEAKSSKSGKEKKAKTKSQIKKDKDGGKKTKRPYTIVEDKSTTGRISDVEADCATSPGTYTISIVDRNSSQFNTWLHNIVSKHLGETHYVTDYYSLDSVHAVVKELSKKLARRSDKSIVLNLTGSYINTIEKYGRQEDLDAFALKIYSAIRDAGIYVSKVVSTAQPGMPLASARAALKLGYALEIHPTADYKVHGKAGEQPVSSKDKFLANISEGFASKEYRAGTMVYDKEEGPFIQAKNPWTRDIVLKDRHTLYVFRDNPDRSSGINKVPSSSKYAQKYGYGDILTYPNTGSAVARGAENAYPISTMKADGVAWSDSEFAKFKKTIIAEINDIVSAFRTTENGFKRVVLPVEDMLEDLPEKFRKWFSDQMQDLQDKINEIVESRVDSEEEENDEKIEEGEVRVDKSMLLSKNEIKLSGTEQSDVSNIRLVLVEQLAKRGIIIMNSSGEQIKASKLFLIMPKDNPSVNIENWSKSKIYSQDGFLITEDILFQLPGSGTVYNLLTSKDKDERAVAVGKLVAIPGLFSSYKQLRRAGMSWLDDEGNPVC